MKYGSSPRFARLTVTFRLLTLLVAFGLGVVVSPYLPTVVPVVHASAGAARPNLDVFLQAWDIAEKHFVYRDALDSDRMLRGAITGMLDALGDGGHTRYLAPSDVALERSSLTGKFEGIGAEVGVRNGRFVIVAPIEGSPAEKAGIRAGDVITQVEGADVEGLSLTDLVNRIRGPRGSTINVTVQSIGSRTPRNISIVRDEIKVQTVTWAMVADTSVAHIRISQFTQNATPELRAALFAAKAAGADRVVVDVRSNPGGYLDQAIGVTSQFVNSGSVLLEQNAAGATKRYSARTGGAAVDLPVVVLIDGGSASASEIFAGALQDHDRARVVGRKTFGTGTVLTSFDLKDGSQMLLGVAQWLTPKGRVIRKVGITPDVDVGLEADDEALSPRDLKSLSLEQIIDTDPQLGRALHALDPARHARPYRPVNAY